MTDAIRKQRERERRMTAGFIRLEFWVPAASADDVKQAVAQVMAERGKDETVGT